MPKRKVDKPVVTDLIIGDSPLKRPSDHTVALMLLAAANGDPIPAECIHGCKVEADGVCEHGHPSWLLKLGYV